MRPRREPGYFAFVMILVLLAGLAHAEDDDPFARARERMVREDLASRGISDGRVLRAMRKVPRHLFIDKRLWDQAYAEVAPGP